MSVGDGTKLVSLDKLKQAAKQIDDEKVIFKIVVNSDGTMEWKTPRTGDPLMDEILARGWIDKARETLLQARQSPLVT